MTGKIVVAVVLVAAALFLPGLGTGPFVDPPEGFHTVIAREMAHSGDWITPRVDGIRYFDKPPLLYWLMAGLMAVVGPGEAAARLGSALPAIALAGLTAWMGTRLASPRVGLLAGLMVSANLEVFLYGRLVKPDLLFVLCITAGLAAFAEAFRTGRQGLVVAGWAALALATLAKDVLGALGPLAVIAAARWIEGRRRGPATAPALGVAVFALIAVPWHALVELRNPGFLWYTIVDNHLLNAARQRAFPDEDVPLGPLEFLGVTAAGFFPWVLAAPWAVARGLRAGGPAEAPWRLLALWATVVIGVFAISPFKLPHYALPAFPALALLTARLWDDALVARPGAPARPVLMLPSLAAVAAVAVACALLWLGRLSLPAEALETADVATRNLAAQGQAAPFMSFAQLAPIFLRLAVTFGLGAVGIAAGLVLRRPTIALVALGATMLAFLPVAGEGFALFAQGRSVRPMAVAVAERVGPDDVLAHEGPLENSGSWLLGLDRRVHVVEGLRSNLAFGATFPEARALLWDRAALRAAWTGGARVLLVSTVRPEQSATQELPPAAVHVLARAGGRILYSNRP